MNKPLLNAAELEHLAEACNATAASTACACLPAQVAAWESVTEERWPDEVLQCIGTLRHPDIEEPTFEERHPSGTRYDSPRAPIAVAFFPFNRCDVFRCTKCRQLFLRYTEFGGYYVAHRVRMVDPALIVQDEP